MKDIITALYERLARDDEQQGESNSIMNQKRYLEGYGTFSQFSILFAKAMLFLRIIFIIGLDICSQKLYNKCEQR